MSAARIGRRSLLIGAIGWTLAAASKAQPTQPAIGDILLGQVFDQNDSVLATIHRVQAAYFHQVNEMGGIGGAQVRLLSFNSSGERMAKAWEGLSSTPGMIAAFGMPAVRLESAVSIPQLFVRDRFLDEGMVGFYPTFELEGTLIGLHIAGGKASGRVAVVHANDIEGLGIEAGLRKALLDRQDVLRVAIQAGDDGVRAASKTLAEARPDVVVLALRRSAFLGLLLQDEPAAPRQRIVTSALTAAAVGTSAALRTGLTGIESVRYLKDAHDPAWSRRTPFHFQEFSRWDNDRSVQAFTALLKRRVPDVDRNGESAMYGYTTAQLMHQVLLQCGPRISRQQVARQALLLGGIEHSLLSPGIRVYTHPHRKNPITQGQFMRFNGHAWTERGEVVDAWGN